MPNLYQTSKDSKTLEIEDTARDGLPFRIVMTLRKLGVVTMLDYFLSLEEAQGIIEALRKAGGDPAREMSIEIGNLPDTLERFIDALDQAREPRGSPIYDLVTSLGAAHRCDVCDTPIIEVKGLVDILAAYYSLNPEGRRQLRDAIMRSGLEIGDNLSPNYCSYHAQITSE